ncbi:unnamed protein product [Camellia sinensis]
MPNVTCRDRRYVNRTPRLGDGVDNVKNAVEKRRLGGENVKQPPNHCFYVTRSFPVPNVTCKDRRYINRTPALGVRVDNAIKVVEKRRSRGKKANQPLNHCFYVTGSFPMPNVTCRDRR